MQDVSKEFLIHLRKHGKKARTDHLSNLETTEPNYATFFKDLATDFLRTIWFPYAQRVLQRSGVAAARNQQNVQANSRNPASAESSSRPPQDVSGGRKTPAATPSSLSKEGQGPKRARLNSTPPQASYNDLAASKQFALQMAETLLSYQKQCLDMTNIWAARFRSMAEQMETQQEKDEDAQE